ncbi:hypothetical protein Tco_1466152 [Tanacetum coccineum]
MSDFNHMIDAKDIWDAIKAKFGSNEESRKLQKTMLKQAFAEFKMTSEEGLDKCYERMQKMLTQMNSLKIKPEQEEVNMCFLRALPESWRQVSLSLRARGGLDLLTFEDLYSKLKFLESDVRGYARPSHAAFVGSSSTSQNKPAVHGSNSSSSYPSYFPSPQTSSNEHSIKVSKVVDDVVYSLLADHEKDQQLCFDDLDQLNKQDLEEYDLKHQMAMLSIRVRSYFQRIIKLEKQDLCLDVYGMMASMYDKSDSEDDVSAEECVPTEVVISADEVVDYADEVVDSADEVVDFAEGCSVPAGGAHIGDQPLAFVGEVHSCSLCHDSKYHSMFKQYSDLRNQFDATVISLNSHKEAVKTFERQIKHYQNNQLAYEEKIRVLSYDLADKSNILEYKEKLINQASQEKQELLAKLDKELANQEKWSKHGQNLFKLIDSSMTARTKKGLGFHNLVGDDDWGFGNSEFSVFTTDLEDIGANPIYNRFDKVDHMKAVPPPMTGNYMPTSNASDDNEIVREYGKQTSETTEIKTPTGSLANSNDSAFFDFSDRSSEPSPKDFSSFDSSMECSEPSTSDNDSQDSTSVKSTGSASEETRVTGSILGPYVSNASVPSVSFSCNSKTKCDNVGSLNKRSLFSNHKSSTSKSCFVCGSTKHLIKDCDYYEKRLDKGRGSRNNDSKRKTPTDVSADRSNPISDDTPISAEFPNSANTGKPICADSYNSAKASIPAGYVIPNLFGPVSVRSINHKIYCLVITDEYTSSTTRLSVLDVSACARNQVSPTTSNLLAVKRIFKYLKAFPKLGLWYPRDSPFHLEAFSDSDYAGAAGDRKSTTGGCQYLGRRLISWQCKKQTIVATSSCEAEYVAAASCCGQVLWIQNQLLDYGFNFMKTKIFIDNQSTISIVKNPVFHQRTKHIEIRHHFIRDAYEKGLIEVDKIPTERNVADLLTKKFDGPRFSFLVVNIGMLNP